MKTTLKNQHHLLLIFLLLICIVPLILSTELRTYVFSQAKLDSLGHFIGFFCLSLLLNSIFKFPLITTVFCLIFYAVLSEIGQYYLGFRNGEFRDVVADTFGITFYLLLRYIYILLMQLKK